MNPLAGITAHVREFVETESAAVRLTALCTHPNAARQQLRDLALSEVDRRMETCRMTRKEALESVTVDVVCGRLR